MLTKDQWGYALLFQCCKQKATDERRQWSETNESSSQGTRSSNSTSRSKHIYYSLPSSSVAMSVQASITRCIVDIVVFLLDKWHANIVVGASNISSCCYCILNEVGWMNSLVCFTLLNVYLYIVYWKNTLKRREKNDLLFLLFSSFYIYIHITLYRKYYWERQLVIEIVGSYRVESAFSCWVYMRMKYSLLITWDLPVCKIKKSAYRQEMPAV